MELFNSLWEKALVNLEDELSVYVIQNWIRALKPVTCDRDTYYFSVELELQQKMVEERFLKEIKNALEEAYEETTGTENGRIDIRIVLDEEAENIRKKKKKEELSVSRETHKSVIPLDTDQTFETFVVGECNRFANQMAKRVAEKPGDNYTNPLFLYGGPSLGKSHLLHAIGNQIKKNNPDAKIVYVSSEVFMNEFISMIRMSGKSDGDFRGDFQKRYRDIDALLIDDIQFFTGKEGIQEEFFNTFESLHNLKKQIVITSDKPPKELEKMEERLLSRFEWGITADIKSPDYETRVAILMEKANSFRKNDPDMPEIQTEVFHYIASEVKSDIRQLGNALRKVIMYAEFSSTEKSSYIDLKMARTALADYIDGTKSRVINPEYIIEFVSKNYNVSVEEIKGRRRQRNIVIPRMIAQYIIQKICDYTYQGIGKIFDCHHTSVMHNIEKVENDIKENEEFKNTVEDLIIRIKE